MQVREWVWGWHLPRSIRNGCWLLEEWLRELSGESPWALKALEDDELLRSPATASAGNEQRNVLNELIVMLIRKQVLTDTEGKALLKKLME
jgi:hypothetical protein